jgi:uncharacterized protein involved in outer membrane biogenesis
MRRLARIGAALAIALALFAAFGYLAVPPLAKAKLQDQLSAELGRPVTVGRVAFDPFLLKGVIEGFEVGGRGGEPQALSFSRLEADASWASLWRLAPVVDSLKLDGLHLRLTRDAQGRYNVQDLVEKWLARPSEPDAPPARFAVANIELAGGRVDFDDAVESVSHRVTDLVIRLPFVSSLPVHQEIQVEPKIAARVNGADFEISGRSRPFADSRETRLELEVEALDLRPYAVYLPLDLPLRIESLRFAGRATVDFVQPVGTAPRLRIAADAILSDVDLREPEGEPLLALSALKVEAMALEPLAGRYEIGKVSIDSPALAMRRKVGQPRFFARLVDAFDRYGRRRQAQAAAVAAPAWSIGELQVRDGRLDLADEHFRPRQLELALRSLALSTGRIDGKLDTAIPVKLAFAAQTGEAGELSGELTPFPFALRASASLQSIALKNWWWLAEPYLSADLADGQLGVRADLSVSTSASGQDIVVSKLGAELRALQLRQRWDRRELLRLASLTVEDGEIAPGARMLRLGAVRSSGGVLALVRDASGRLNLERALEPGAAPASEQPSAGASSAAGAPTQPSGGAPTQPSAAAPAQPWSVELGRLSLERFAASVRDTKAGRTADLDLTELSLQAEGLGTKRGSRGSVALKARFGSVGTLESRGRLGLVPLSATLRVDARSLAVLPMQPYFEPYVNLVVSSGALSASGEVAFELPEAGEPRASYRGSATLADFAAVTRDGREDLLRWKTLNVSGIDFALQPLKVDVGEIALADFYSRLIIDPSGRFNLQDVVVGGDSGTSGPPAPSVVSAGSATPPPVRIGSISLANGNIDFTDLFVRPNYSANLTGMTGSIGRITPDTAGEVELRGRIDNAGSVEIRGKVNPLASSLFLDLNASARDIDLPRASPYSVKYLGYGIEKGKLSANVKYRVQDRKLQAENNVVLDQLTFGEKVDSPTATKLPVLFAVALLKDRHGVIDVNMPIGGSLDDPEFSIGGIVLRIIVNIITKAVTAPFTLLASIGGGGPELSYLEFAPGRAALDAEALKRLGALAKALADRPALKLDVSGRADPQRDAEQLRRDAFERRLKAEKLRETVRGGAAAGAVDSVVIEPAEYPKYLLQAYRATDIPKPRTAAGALRELSAADMEQLLLSHMQVGGDALRGLAMRRAEAAKEWLAGPGGVAGERVFVVAPKLGGEGIQAGGSAGRAEFSLK